MLVESILLFILVCFFASGMGGSNFGASFAVAHGSGILSKKKAQALFVLFVFLGAVILGRPVAATLGQKIVPQEILTRTALLVIFFSAGVTMLTSNLLHVPQSTSFVIIAAIAGVGLYFNRINLGEFLFLVPFWVVLPLVGYLLTLLLVKAVYPPRDSNFWIYERLFNHQRRLKAFVVASSCYNAFSVGANNVPNVAGPIAGAGVFSKTSALALTAPLFGAGGIIFHGPIKTAGERIVPLGMLTGAIVCVVTGTLMIIASALGVPQSFVMVKMASVFAVSSAKNGHRTTFSSRLMKRTYLTWIFSPVFALLVSYLLSVWFM